MLTKTDVYTQCLLAIDEKVAMLSNALKLLAEDAATETKSSAGDKHETAKAMVHLEQEKIDRQLNEAQEQKSVLTKIDSQQTHTKVFKGSLVSTNKGVFFISIGLGKINVKDQAIFCISAESPLAKLLLGLTLKQSTTFNGTNYTIEAVC